MVVVLWALLPLAAIGGASLLQARGDRAEAAGASAALRLRHAADGAIEHTVFALVGGPAAAAAAGAGGDWPIDGTERAVALFGREVSVGVATEAGKIDLNAAPRALLAALFRARGGLPPPEADALADRVEDWRAPAAARPGFGDPAEAYRSAGRTYGPRRGPFPDVSELRLVLGMTDALQDAVAPLLTVHSGSPAVDRGAAGEAVLRVLEDAGDRLAAAQLAARAAGRAAGTDRALAPGEAFTVSARLAERGRVEERRAVLRLAGGRRAPFVVLEWR